LKDIKATIIKWYSYNRYGYCKVKQSDILYYFDSSVFEDINFKPKNDKGVCVQICSHVIINLREI